MSRRILVLCGDPGVPALGPSGASAHLRGVVGALGAHGDVGLAVSARVDHRGPVDADLDVPVVTASTRAWRRLGRWRERSETWGGRWLARRARRELGEPALIWERFSLFCDGGLRLAGATGAAHVVELNAPLSVERPDLRDVRYARAVEGRVLRGATRVVAVSAWLRRWAIDEVGCDPDRVRHVPNGTNCVRPGHRDETRARLGLSGMVLGFVGSLKAWHGLAFLPSLLDALPEATVVVAGSGPEAVPDHPRLRALGRVAPRDLPDVVSAFDVGLAPYAPDGPPWFCPLKVLDYRAQGVPVLATRVGDVAHLVGADGGCVMGTLDPDAWAAAARHVAVRPRIRWARPWSEVVAEALHDLPCRVREGMRF